MRETISKSRVKALLQTVFGFATENGILYAVDENGDPGNKVGYLKDGEPFFY